MLRSKFAKSLSFLKQQIAFSSNFASPFSVMRHNFSVLSYLKFYILSTKGAYQSINLVKFEVSSRKSEILHFDGIFLFKSYKVSTKKVQKSCLWWHLRVVPSLKKHWLVVSNLKCNFMFIWHQKFREISSNHSKVWKFHFDGFFFSKVYEAWAKKNTEKLSFMTLNSDGKFE